MQRLVSSESPKVAETSDSSATTEKHQNSEDWPWGTHYIEVPTLPLARKLLGPSSESLRKERSKVYFDTSSDAARLKLRLGMHDRGEEYLFAEGKIHESDLEGHKRHLPLHLKLVRIKEHVIKKGEILDVTASHKSWNNLHFREELYVYLYFEKLIVESGASLKVHGNVLVLSCDEIILLNPEESINKTNSSEEFDFKINILGTKHAAFSAIRRIPTTDGDIGCNGANGKNGNATRITTTPFGPTMEVTNNDLSGEIGENGYAGTNGSSGQNGGMAMLADIRIKKLKNFGNKSIQIFVQAGKGLNGGNGGHGGHGGHGGTASQGINSENPGGVGGKGGDGGKGGNGGNGGNGGLSSNVFVQVAAEFIECISLFSCESVGGDGGYGGDGGQGGNHGKNDKYYSGEKPKNGSLGHTGQNGRKGRSRPAARIHLIAIKETQK